MTVPNKHNDKVTKICYFFIVTISTLCHGYTVCAPVKQIICDNLLKVDPICARQNWFAYIFYVSCLSCLMPSCQPQGCPGNVRPRLGQSKAKTIGHNKVNKAYIKQLLPANVAIFFYSPPEPRFLLIFLNYTVSQRDLPPLRPHCGEASPHAGPRFEPGMGGVEHGGIYGAAQGGEID